MVTAEKLQITSDVILSASLLRIYAERRTASIKVRAGSSKKREARALASGILNRRNCEAATGNVLCQLLI